MRGLDAGHVRVGGRSNTTNERSMKPGGRWKLTDGRSFNHRILRQPPRHTHVTGTRYASAAMVNTTTSRIL